MTQYRDQPPPVPLPGSPAAPPSVRPPLGPAIRVTVIIAIGGAVLGAAGGLIWAAVAPRPVFQVYQAAPHPNAYVVSPETSAFIAADAWFSLIAVVGGVLIGLAGYLLGVRRHGPLPAAGILVGATGAAFLAWSIGQHIGLAGFRHQLAVSSVGALIRQPAQLGARGALAFWPLAAGAVVAAIELTVVLRDRRARDHDHERG